MNYVYRYEIAAVIITFAVMISLFRKKVISTKAANAFSSINFLVFVLCGFIIQLILCIRFRSTVLQLLFIMVFSIFPKIISGRLYSSMLQLFCRMPERSFWTFQTYLQIGFFILIRRVTIIREN